MSCVFFGTQRSVKCSSETVAELAGMKPKVDAIFDLREAAEEHGRAGVVLDKRPDSQEARFAVFEARAKLEAATVEAVESCHQCGQPKVTADHI